MTETSPLISPTPQSTAPSPAPTAPIVRAPATPAKAPPAKLSNEQYDRLTMGEKSAYARSFPQGQNRPAAPARPSSAEWAGMTPEQRFAFDRQNSDALTDAQRPMVADPNAPPEGDAPADQPAAEKVKIGQYEFDEQEVAELLKTKAEADLRKTKIPADPSGYKLDLPKDLPAPEGFKFEFDQSSPILKDAAAFAHRSGFDQDQFSAMLGLYAVHQIQEAATFQTARNAEVAKLGALGTTRVTAIQTFLKGHLGSDLANAMMPMLVTAKIVEGFEKLAGIKSSQGTASFTQVGRDTGDSRRVDQATYDTMSYTEKKEYARQFENGNGRRR